MWPTYNKVSESHNGKYAFVPCISGTVLPVSWSIRPCSRVHNTHKLCITVTALQLNTVLVLHTGTTLMVLMSPMHLLSQTSQMSQIERISQISHSCTRNVLTSTISPNTPYCKYQKLHGSLFLWPLSHASLQPQLLTKLAGTDSSLGCPKR